MKEYYKIVNENIIEGFGTNGPNSVEEITEDEYYTLMDMFINRPSASIGYVYLMQDSPREWILVEIPIEPEESDNIE